MAAILAIDDEEAILLLIQNALKKEGHQVTCVSSITDSLTCTLTRYDLILLDVMMPGIDGFSFCQKIRGLVDCPILFLTAKSLEEDVTYGFSLGADDYIKKPFSVAELRARINAHLRREQREKHLGFCVGDIQFQLSSRDVLVQGERLPLTKSEYDICLLLARNHGQTFSREQIYENVFGYEGESDTSVITEHIKNIRRKLAAFDITPVETVWGIGYRWNS